MPGPSRLIAANGRDRTQCSRTTNDVRHPLRLLALCLFFICVLGFIRVLHETVVFPSSFFLSLRGPDPLRPHIARRAAHLRGEEFNGTLKVSESRSPASCRRPREISYASAFQILSQNRQAILVDPLSYTAATRS